MASNVSFCGHCGIKASAGCAGCRNMTYCSVECQQADWQFHKHLCKQWEEFKEKPGPDLRRAIVLPEYSSTPYFKWLRVPEGSDVYAAEELGKKMTAAERRELDIHICPDTGVPNCDRVEGMVFPDNQETYGPGAPTRHFIDVVVGKTGSGELLDHSIHLWMPDFQPSIRPNACLAKFAGVKVAKRYHGELVFVAMTKVEQPAWTLDLDTRDLTLALDGLVEYNKKVLLQYMYHSSTKKPKKLKSLKINVTKPFFERVDVPVRHPIFRPNAQHLLAAQNIPSPLRMHKYRAPANPPTPTDNEAIEDWCGMNYLRINADRSSPAYGTFPAKFHDEDGASILLATTGSDLSMQSLADAIVIAQTTVVPKTQGLFDGMTAEEKIKAVIENLKAI